MTTRGVRGRADLARLISDRGEHPEADRRLATLIGYEEGGGPPSRDREASAVLSDGEDIGDAGDVDPSSVTVRSAPPDPVPLPVPARVTFFEGTEEDMASGTETVERCAPVIWTTRPNAVPHCPPLRPWRSLVPLLRRLIMPDLVAREVDIPRVVERLAKGLSVETPPRRHRPRAPERLVVVKDRNPRLIPLWADQDALTGALSVLFPHTEIQTVTPVLPAGRFVTAKGESVPPGDDGTPWLVLGDLGALSGGSPDPWAGLARAVTPGRAIALTPMGRDEVDPVLRDLWRVEPWEEAVGLPSRDDGGREALADRLLTLLSPAVGFSPGLLRAMRRTLLPQADIAVELAAWNTAGIEVRSSVMTTLTKEGTEERRARFEREGTDDHRVGALRVIRSWRTGLDKARAAEDFWFIEILGLSRRTQALLEDHCPGDLEMARAFFRNLEWRLRWDGEGVGDGTLAWLSVMADRAPEACVRSNHFWRAARRVKARDPGFTPPKGLEMPLVEGMTSVGQLAIAQTGRDLVAAVGEAVPEGSPLAVLPSDNGIVDIDPLEDDGWGKVWGPDGVPGWVEDYGTDDHGRWCRFSYKGISQTMRWCPPGRFRMGSPEDEPERMDYEGPRTDITFVDGFWLFDTCVTQALYEAVVGRNPSYFKEDGANRPVEQVSLEDAQSFLNRLNDAIPGLGLSIPSEAQWEYACRAGSETPFEPTVAARHGGRDVTAEEVNYDGNHPLSKASKGLYRQETVPVKGVPFRPNAWGLWHMHGNVDEWCADIWHDSHDGAEPFGKPRLESGTGVRDRVVRGGSWFYSAGNYCRAAIRFTDEPDVRGSDLGFRPAGGHSTSSSQPGSDPVPGTAGKSEAPAVRDLDRRAERVRASPDREARVGLPAAPFILRTDRAELVIERKTRADFPWASAAGRDRFGLWSEFTHADVTQRLRWCPPGRFLMGSPEGEPGRYDDEGPRTDITISEGFWLFDTPVTQALYEAVMGSNPSRFRSPDRPVEQVRWEDAQGFLKRLNEKIPGLGLFLPSEAQWEYACRAGTRDATYAGPMEIRGERNAPILEDIAWYGGNSGVDLDLKKGRDSSDWKEKAHDHHKAGTRLVKGKRANPWGLYDMLGNVWEWSADVWHDSHEGADAFGKPRLESGTGRVVRGGSWINHAGGCRAAIRLWFAPDDRDDDLGFRPAGGHPTSSSQQESVPIPGTAGNPEAPADQDPGRRAAHGGKGVGRLPNLLKRRTENQDAD